MLDYLWLTIRSQVRRHIRSERGSMAIEYIGLAILSLAVIGLLVNYLNGASGDGLGSAFVGKIEELIKGVTGPQNP